MAGAKDYREGNRTGGTRERFLGVSVEFKDHRETGRPVRGEDQQNWWYY